MGVDVHGTAPAIIASLENANITIGGADWKIVTDRCDACGRGFTDAHHAGYDPGPPRECRDGHGVMRRTQQALVPAGPEVPA